MVSIVTATYNREKNIVDLYRSLLRQTSKKFKWIIVDDGSTDRTSNIVREMIEEQKIKIYYFIKANGGKHTAINYILNKKELLDELIFFVDSDDTLKENAIQLIEENYKKIKGQDIFSGLCFQRINKKNGTFMCKNFPKYIYDSDIFEMIKRYKIYGDKAEVFFREDLIKYRFPEIKGEKLFSELYIWMELTRNKKMRFINEGIYYCEYLNEGYTKNFSLLLQNNIKGMEMYYKKITLESRFGFLFRIRALYRLLQVLLIKKLRLKLWK